MPQASPTTRELRSFLQNEYPIGRVRKITPLKKDEAAGVFEVMTNSRAYIFKYNGQRFRLRNEAEILRRLQPFDVAPRIILPDGRRSYVRFRAVDAFLYEKISGQSAPLSLGLLKKMGLLLSKMHRVPWGDYPFAPRSFSQAAKDWRDFYFFNLPAGQPAETFAALLTTMRSLPKLDDLPLAFTHGDPHAGNFVRDPDERFMLIDFELGSLAPRFSDAGYVLTSIGTAYRPPFRKLAAAEAFLSSYTEKLAPSKREWRALPFLMDLHLFSHAIDWGTMRLLPGNVSRYARFRRSLLPLLERHSKRKPASA